jgi:hypothetical protein
MSSSVGCTKSWTMAFQAAGLCSEKIDFLQSSPWSYSWSSESASCDVEGRSLLFARSVGIRPRHPFCASLQFVRCVACTLGGVLALTLPAFGLPLLDVGLLVSELSLDCLDSLFLGRSSVFWAIFGASGVIFVFFMSLDPCIFGRVNVCVRRMCFVRKCIRRTCVSCFPCVPVLRWGALGPPPRWRSLCGVQRGCVR